MNDPRKGTPLYNAFRDEYRILTGGDMDGFNALCSRARTETRPRSQPITMLIDPCAPARLVWLFMGIDLDWFSAMNVPITALFERSESPPGSTQATLFILPGNEQPQVEQAREIHLPKWESPYTLERLLDPTASVGLLHGLVPLTGPDTSMNRDAFPKCAQIAASIVQTVLQSGMADGCVSIAQRQILTTVRRLCNQHYWEPPTLEELREAKPLLPA